MLAFYVLLAHGTGGSGPGIDMDGWGGVFVYLFIILWAFGFYWTKMRK